MDVHKNDGDNSYVEKNSKNTMASKKLCKGSNRDHLKTVGSLILRRFE